MIEARLVRAATGHPAALLAAAALLTALLLVYTVGVLRLDTNPDRLLDPNLPYLQTERALKQAFPQGSDSIVLVIDGASATHAGAVARRLVARLREETRLIESVYAPGESDFFARNGLLFLERAELEALGDRLAEAAPYLGVLAQDTSLRGLFRVLSRSVDEEMTAAQREQFTRMLATIAGVLEAQAAGKPGQIAWREALMGGLSGADSAARRFIVVQPRFDYESFDYAEDALAAVRILVRAESPAEADVRIRITGDVPMESEELQSVGKEMSVATALSFALVLVLLFVALRSRTLVVAVVTTLLMGLIWTAAFAAFAIGYLNLISVSFAVLFIGFGVDFGIQFGLRYREEATRGDIADATLGLTARGVGPALTLAAATAAAGFFSFAPTSYRGLAELGIIAGASMFLALIANLTVLPALLKLLPAPRTSLARETSAARRTRSLLERHSRTIALTALVAAAGSLVLLPQARFDFNPLNMKDPTTESVATFMELLRDPETSPYTIEVLAANAAEAKNVASSLEKLPTVARTVTLENFVPAGQQEKLAVIEDMRLVLAPLLLAGAGTPAPADEEIRAWSELREKLAAAAAAHPARSDGAVMLQLGSALERLEATAGWPADTLNEARQRIISDLPEQFTELRRLMTPTPVSLADVPADLASRYLAPDRRARVEVFPKEDLSDNDALRRFVREVQTVVPNATGAPVALLEGGDAVVRACVEAAALAFAAALVLLAIVLRSVRDVLFVILPMVLAGLFTTAASVLIDLPFDLANVIALPLLVTMTVAYAIYLVMRERAQNDFGELFDSSTPRAVLFSALTTGVAFGSMAFSAHRGMSSMGLLLAMSLGFSLLCTLVVLPALLALRPRRS